MRLAFFDELAAPVEEERSPARLREDGLSGLEEDATLDSEEA